jgi:hypothetical protein
MDPKAFVQRQPIGSTWRYNLNNVRRVLYRLPSILQSTRPIIIVEGEKDQHTLEKMGFLATTCSGGAGGWRPEFAESLKGRVCLNLPDNDPAGEEFSAVIHTWIPNLIALRLPGLRPKGDVTDWVEAGGTAKELGELFREAAREKMRRTADVLRAIGGKCDLSF